MKILDVNGKTLHANAVLPYRGYELSLTTITRHPELCVFKDGNNVTPLLFDGSCGALVGTAGQVREAMEAIDKALDA